MIFILSFLFAYPYVITYFLVWLPRLPLLKLLFEIVTRERYELSWSDLIVVPLLFSELSHMDYRPLELPIDIRDDPCMICIEDFSEFWWKY